MASHAEYWAGYKNDELLCVWPIPIVAHAPAQIPFSHYVGPLWSSDFHRLPVYKQYSNSQSIYEGLITEILGRHASISIELSPTLTDVRVFSWWNYHFHDRPRFRVQPRYTARVQGLRSKDASALVAGFRKDDRRKSIRKLLRMEPLEYRLAEEWATSRIVDMYAATLDAGGGSLSDDAARALERIIMISQSRPDLGSVIALSHGGEKQIVAAQVCLKDDLGVHAVALCVDAEHKRNAAGVFLTYQSILKAQRDGADYYDFNGANSPNRADDKHAYGACPLLYFSMSI